MTMHSASHKSSLSRRLRPIAAILCAYAAGSVSAGESELSTGLSFWGTAGDQSQFTAAQGPSLLRPPASWSWDNTAPQLDMAAGVGHRFASGLNLDLGMSLSHTNERTTSINYHDYFLGLSYGSLDGKVWYLPETTLTEVPALYYEAGWKQAVTENFSLSLRLGQYSTGYVPEIEGSADLPSLSLGASTQVRGYGLGLRLIDNGGHMFGGEQDLRLMGSISKPLP